VIPITIYLKLLIIVRNGRTPWTEDQPLARPLPTQDNSKQKKRIHTFMARAGFESTPALERLRPRATVIAYTYLHEHN
jgi:hypothetical protein